MTGVYWWMSGGATSSPEYHLAEGVVYHVNSRWCSEIEGVVVVVCVVVRDKGCEVGFVAYVEYGDRVK